MTGLYLLLNSNKNKTEDIFYFGSDENFIFKNSYNIFIKVNSENGAPSLKYIKEEILERLENKNNWSIFNLINNIKKIPFLAPDDNSIIPANKINKIKVYTKIIMDIYSIHNKTTKKPPSTFNKVILSPSYYTKYSKSKKQKINLTLTIKINTFVDLNIPNTAQGEKIITYSTNIPDQYIYFDQEDNTILLSIKEVNQYYINVITESFELNYNIKTKYINLVDIGEIKNDE